MVPGFFNSYGVDVMLIGGMGIKAIDYFQQFSIRVETGVTDTVRLALERYLGGEQRRAKPYRESVEHYQNSMSKVIPMRVIQFLTIL
jgi:predicted Fe-Mo cluster-binding NifX family protein